MERDEREALISQYARGIEMIAAAVRGLDDARLDARESPDAWSTREVIHHLADSEIASATRLRQLIAQDSPEIAMYDQAQYARVLFFDRPISPSLDVIKAIRQSNTQIIRRMSDAQWKRAGTHSGNRVMSAEDWLRIYVGHIETHVDQLRRANTSAG